MFGVRKACRELSKWWNDLLLENKQLKAENAELRKRITELDELLPENERWFSSETVEAYVEENAKLRALCHDLRKEYAYLKARPHETCMNTAIDDRMAIIDDHMRKLGIEVE